ncbi:helix-turn-helix domain-containing protein [Amycolatopsis japonica]
MNGHAKTFSADVTAPSTGPDRFDTFRHAWATQVGEVWPLAGLDIGESGDFRIKAQAVTLHDTVIADVHSASFLGQTTAAGGAGDRVLIHLMRRGAWRFTRPGGETTAVPAGSFIARHNGPPSMFAVDPGATARVLILPAPVLEPLLGGRQHVTGSADSAEVRLLTAHASMIGETAHDLGPAGVRGARDALFELAKGVLRREFDDVEPRLAPALARAAMEIAERRLTDPELTPASLARELNVSVRTLHRAFAMAEESVAAYIRRRRLEHARLELAAPLGRPSVSEVAARWQFADSSHFIRAFKNHYAQTPAEFAREREI